MSSLSQLARGASPPCPATTAKWRRNRSGHGVAASTQPDFERTGTEPKFAGPPSRSEHKAPARRPAHCAEPAHAPTPGPEPDCASSGDNFEPVHTGHAAALSFACGLRLTRGWSVVAMAGAGWPLSKRLYTLPRAIAGKDAASANAKLAVSSHVQDYGLADICAEQHATRDAVF